MSHFTGAIAMTLVYPAYTMQNRMVVAPEGHYKGIVDCFSKTVRMEGWAALAKGYTPSLVRVLPLRGIDMGLFNTLKQMFVTDGHTITVPQSLAFGGVWGSSRVLCRIDWQASYDSRRQCRTD